MAYIHCWYDSPHSNPPIRTETSEVYSPLNCPHCIYLVTVTHNRPTPLDTSTWHHDSHSVYLMQLSQGASSWGPQQSGFHASLKPPGAPVPQLHFPVLYGSFHPAVCSLGIIHDVACWHHSFSRLYYIPSSRQTTFC